MEVIIKNKGSETQKCVLFSYYDRCFNSMKSGDDFLSLDTGVQEVIDGIVSLKDDIEIYIDGDSSDEKRLEFLKSIGSNIFRFKYIDFTSDVIISNFRVLNTDANGSVFIKYIFPSHYIDSHQENPYPIMINDKSLKWIDSMTAFLFKVKANQEIKLNFVQ